MQNGLVLHLKNGCLVEKLLTDRKYKGYRSIKSIRILRFGQTLKWY